MDTNNLLAHLRQHYAGRTFEALDIASDLGAVLRDVRLGLNRLLKAGQLERVGRNGGLRLAAPPAPMPAAPVSMPQGAATARRIQELEDQLKRVYAEKEAAELAQEGKIELEAELEKARHKVGDLEGELALVRDCQGAERQERETLRSEVAGLREKAGQLEAFLQDARSLLERGRLEAQEARLQAESDACQLATARVILSRLLVPRVDDVVVEMGSPGLAGSLYLPELNKFCWVPDMPGQRPAVTVQQTFSGASEKPDPQAPPPAAPRQTLKPQPVPDAALVEQVLGLWLERPDVWFTPQQAAIELGLLKRQVKPAIDHLVEQGKLEVRGDRYRAEIAALPPRPMSTVAEAKPPAPPPAPATPPKLRAKRLRPPEQPADQAAPVKPKPRPAPPKPKPKPRPGDESAPLLPPAPARPHPSLSDAIVRTLREAGRPLSRSLLLSRLVHPNRAGFDVALDELVGSGQVAREDNRYRVAGGSA